MVKRGTSYLNGTVIVCFTVVVLLCSFISKKEENINFVFIGDSITEGAGLKDADRHAPPVYTVDYLRKEKKIKETHFSNQGISGFTTVNFLPSNGATFDQVIKAARQLKSDANTQLVFSVMLGTNDSAITGPLGSPVSGATYFNNLKQITDSLLAQFPKSIIVIHHPIWYSPNTQNGSKYLQEGLDRLQTYFPQIAQLVKSYQVSHPSRVFVGDQKGFKFFEKKHEEYFQHEQGGQGVFYLHPNEAGARVLGELWAQAIFKVLKNR